VGAMKLKEGAVSVGIQMDRLSNAVH